LLRKLSPTLPHPGCPDALPADCVPCVGGGGGDDPSGSALRCVCVRVCVAAQYDPLAPRKIKTYMNNLSAMTGMDEEGHLVGDEYFMPDFTEVRACVRAQARAAWVWARLLWWSGALRFLRNRLPPWLCVPVERPALVFALLSRVAGRCLRCVRCATGTLCGRVLGLVRGAASFAWTCGVCCLRLFLRVRPWPPRQIDRVIACSVSHEDFKRDPHQPGVLFLVKWMSLPYSECTWETLKDVDNDDAVAAFWKRQVMPKPVSVPRPALRLCVGCARA
jgi:hypothetical protein